MDIVELPGFPGIACGYRDERAVLIVGSDISTDQARTLASVLCTRTQLRDFDAWLAARRRAAG
jgi:hypothetical protein